MTVPVTNRGAEWRIWDLHVHTPCSLVQHYGGDNDATWERYLAELESMPSEIRMIGINDYWFLDGYRRVRDAKLSGRLQNLDAIFPVLELRTDQFGGSDSSLKKANLHVIFDPTLGDEVIEQQFMNRLHAEFKLDAEHEHPTWQQVVTRASLIELGRDIREHTPADKRAQLGSDLQLGFGNLVVQHALVMKTLQESSALRGKYVTALGKAEWSSIRWNNQSIAIKKSLASDADLLFTAFADPTQWQAEVEKLADAGVNRRLLDCSDAHHWSDSTEKDRIGACQTWIKSSPSLAGLKHALREFDHRAYVGLEPPVLSRVRRAPETYIDRVRVLSDDASLHLTFDHDLALNSGFVAIVGNKGQGKSALLDCVALAGNSGRTAEYGFLNDARFLAPANRAAAKHYYAEVVWRSGATRRANFLDGHDSGAPTAVEYLPQRFVERVCALDPGSEEQDEFEAELRRVLFTHIDEADRLGETSFEGLLDRRAESPRQEARNLRQQLRPLIQRYEALARFRAENDLDSIQRRLALRQADAAAARRDLASAEARLSQIDGESGDDRRLAELRHEAEQLSVTRIGAEKALTVSTEEIAKLRQARTSLRALVQRARAVTAEAEAINHDATEALGDVLPDAQTHGTLVRVTVERGFVGVAESRLDESERHALEVRSNIEARLRAAEERTRAIDAELELIDTGRERARQQVLQVRERVKLIEGDERDSASVHGLIALRDRVQTAPAEMKKARDALLAKAAQVFAALTDELTTVQSLYSPAAAFIAQSPLTSAAEVEFRAELRVTPAWSELPSRLDGRRAGDLADHMRGLGRRLIPVEWTALHGELESTLIRLEAERSQHGEAYRDPSIALRSGYTLGSLLEDILALDWIETRFELTGAGNSLQKLSPGQRGLILALFYLVVDRRGTPLLLDQPEENLDNATIKSFLVPAIRDAALHRQTIIVTHNANLAIVGDADQIVHCEYSAGRFQLSAGCISEIDTARSAVDILEGTMPAFDNRRRKYAAFPELLETRRQSG